MQTGSFRAECGSDPAERGARLTGRFARFREYGEHWETFERLSLHDERDDLRFSFLASGPGWSSAGRFFARVQRR